MRADRRTRYALHPLAPHPLVLHTSATASAADPTCATPGTSRPSASTTRQPATETTGTPPRRIASATSLSVPHDPPTTITASALQTSTALRASPMFVTTTTS